MFPTLQTAETACSWMFFAPWRTCCQPLKIVCSLPYRKSVHHGLQKEMFGRHCRSIIDWRQKSDYSWVADVLQTCCRQLVMLLPCFQHVKSSVAVVMTHLCSRAPVGSRRMVWRRDVQPEHLCLKQVLPTECYVECATLHFCAPSVAPSRKCQLRSCPYSSACVADENANSSCKIFKVHFVYGNNATTLASQG